MKIRILIFFNFIFVQTLFTQNSFESDNISVISRIPKKSSRIAYWKQAEKNKQYAILGGNEYTYFYDISNPQLPVLADSIEADNFFAGLPLCVFKNFLFDSSSGTVYAYDLSALPDSVVYKGFWPSYFYPFVNTTFNQSELFKWFDDDIYVYSLNNYLDPVLTDSLREDIKHISGMKKVIAKNDTVLVLTDLKVYTLHFKNGKFSILDSMANPYAWHYYSSAFATSPGQNQLLISSAAGPCSAALYSQIDNQYQFIKKQFLAPLSETCIASYMNDSFLAAANSTAGIHIYNVSDPANIVGTGSFNCRRDTSGPNLTGIIDFCTGLNNDFILGLDGLQGVFILDPKKAMPQKPTASIPQPELNYDISLFPNPGSEKISIQLKRDFPCRLSISNTLGISVFVKDYSGSIDDQISILPFSEGTYILKVEGNEGQLTGKFLVFH